LLVGRWRTRRIEVVARIEYVVAHKLVDIAVEFVGAGFGLGLNRARTIAPILSAIVGSKNADFSDCIDTGIDVEGLVAAVIQNVAPINLPVVVLGTTAIEIEGKELNSNQSFVRSTTNPGHQRN